MAYFIVGGVIIAIPTLYIVFIPCFPRGPKGKNQPFQCTHTCLCPCERSHLETLCIYTYHHKHTYIIPQMYHKYVCVSTLAVHSHLLVRLLALTLRTPSYTYISPQVYIYPATRIYIYISQIRFRVNPCCALTLACALASAHT